MDIIKFEGAWTEQNKRVISTVVSRAEGVLALDVPRSIMGKPWICRCEVEDEQPMYIASRVNLDYTFTGTTIPDLVKDLVLMCGEKRRQASVAPYWSLRENIDRRADHDERGGGLT